MSPMQPCHRGAARSSPITIDGSNPNGGGLTSAPWMSKRSQPFLCVALSHPFIKRLIGTLPREDLAHVLFSNARDVERTLEALRD